MALYKDGPLWVEGNPGEKPRLKTFLSATKEEMESHGFTPVYKDCYEITKDGKLTYVKDETNDFWNPLFTLPRETPDCFSRFYGHADAILWYAIGRNDHTDEPTYGKREKSLEMEVESLNPRFNSVFEGRNFVKHSFEFRQGAEDLFQSLSDVDAVIQMAESMKGLSVLSSVEIDVKKQDELYHVQIEGAPIKWSLYNHCVIERDVSAQNMAEFLPQLQKAELEYCDAELKFLKDTIESQREEWKTVTESESAEYLESPEELDRLTKLVEQTQSQREAIEQSLKEETEEELDDRGR